MTTPRVLVAFVDALGPAQLESMSSAFSFVPHRGALSGIFGYSSGAIATVLTGAPARQHGRMCLFAQAEATRVGAMSPLSWLGLLPRCVHERGPVRRAIAKLFAAATDNSGYVALHKVPPSAFRWLDLPEREDLFEAPDVNGQKTFLASAREAGLSVAAARWQLPEAERFAALEHSVRIKQPRLVLAYGAALDGALHVEGNGGARSKSAATNIGAHIQRLRDLMSQDGDVTTVVVGDHGMADVRRAVDPRNVTASFGDLRHFVDSTLFRIWGSKMTLDRVRARIERERWPGTWLDQDALRSREAPTAGSPYGDAIFVLEEGAIFAPSWVGGFARGMHGYDAGGASTFAAVASDREIPAGLRSLADIRPHVERALGLS
jgi:hypothetical protein